MSAAELQEMRNEVVDFMDHYADEDMVRQVFDLIHAGEVDDAAGGYLTPEQEAILEKRMELHRKGLTTYSSWDEVKARIISNRKNGL